MDERAILRGLKSGKIAGYAADVLWGSPHGEDLTLLAAYTGGAKSSPFPTSHG